MLSLLAHIKSMANEVHHIPKKHITHSGSKYNLKISGISIFKFQNVSVINILVNLKVL